jgi:hypothetical protein
MDHSFDYFFQRDSSNGMYTYCKKVSKKGDNERDSSTVSKTLRSHTLWEPNRRDLVVVTKKRIVLVTVVTFPATEFGLLRHFQPAYKICAIDKQELHTTVTFFSFARQPMECSSCPSSAVHGQRRKLTAQCYSIGSTCDLPLLSCYHFRVRNADERERVAPQKPAENCRVVQQLCFVAWEILKLIGGA